MIALLVTLLALHVTSAAAKPSPNIDPAWSHDGRSIAFSRLVDEGNGIDTSGHVWIVGRDGHGARPVTDVLDPASGTYYADPQWSPDGAWLAVQDESRYSTPGIAVVRTDGRDLTLIATATGSPAEALYAAWSPDGKRLALAGTSGLYLVDRDVWKAQFLAPVGGVPSWSPDGTRIVGSLADRLAVVAIDSGAVTKLPAPPAPAAWSPDGTRIAYANGCEVGVVAATATAASARPRPCVRTTAVSAPSWSPDSRRFVYSRCVRVVDCGVYVATAADPGQARKIARGEGATWSPDGRRIAYTRRVGDTFYGIWLIYPNGAGAHPLLH